MWSCAEWICTFGALIPFLQIAFGVNALFSAWDGIYESLTRSHRALQTSDDTLLGVVDADPYKTQRLEQQRQQCETQRRDFRQWGRWGGFAAALGIALALLLVAEQTAVSGLGLGLVLVSGFGMPVFMLVMFFAGLWCTRQTTAEANRIAREAAEAATRAKDEARDLARDIQPNGENSQC